MKKIIEINGMHCEKCKGRVENALNSIEGVSAKVNLAKKCAVVTFKSDIGDDVFADTVKALGFEVVSIKEKRSIFG